MHIPSYVWHRAKNWVDSSTRQVFGTSAVVEGISERGKAAVDGQTRSDAHETTRHIPPETLHLIFQFVQLLPGAEDGHQLASEIRLSHVSQCWRAICLSSSDMWTSFRAVRASPASHARLNAYLTRSRRQMLDLEFYFQSASGCSLLQEIIPHRHRWQSLSLTFHCDPEPLLCIGKYLLPSEAPNLRALTILPKHTGMQNRSVDGLIKKDAHSFQRAPLTMRLNGESALACSTLFDRVTELRLDATWHSQTNRRRMPMQEHWIHWSTFCEILALPSLVRLSIQGQPYALPSGWETKVSRVWMPHVRHFEYSACYGSSAFEDLMLPNLDAPCLETLALERMGPPNEPTHWDPCRLQPLDSLRTLRLTGFVEYDYGFVAALASLTPKISHLAIENRAIPAKNLLARISAQGVWGSVERLTVNEAGYRVDEFVGVTEVRRIMALCAGHTKAL